MTRPVEFVAGLLLALGFVTVIALFFAWLVTALALSRAVAAVVNDINVV